MRILFISQSACRSGAPILLLHFLRWLRDERYIDFEILLTHGGELQCKFEELGRVWGPLSESAPVRRSPRSMIGRVLDGMRTTRADQSAAIVPMLAERNFNLVYSNTIVNGRLLNRLSELDVPTICHVHEMEYWIRERTAFNDLQGTLANCKEFIAVSNAVKRNLVENHGVLDESCQVIHGFIPTNAGHLAKDGDAKKKVCSRFGIPQDAQIVGGCGRLDWGKGADLFVQVGREIANRSYFGNVHFLWIGGDEGAAPIAQMRHDAERAGVGQRVHFVGSQENPADIFSAFDVFVLTSRSDSYPLVMLEAAAGGAPVVGFAKSGGVSEFVGDDAGVIVPYLDVGAMAQAVTRLLRDVDLRAEMGDAGRRKVVQDHNVAVAGNKILNVIEQVVQTRELAISSSEVRV